MHKLSEEQPGFPGAVENHVFGKQQSASHDCPLTRGGQQKKEKDAWETAGLKQSKGKTT